MIEEDYKQLTQGVELATGSCTCLLILVDFLLHFVWFG